MLLKYKANGDVAWKRVYDSEFHDDDVPHDMIEDRDGNIIVVGSSRVVRPAGAEFDYLTAKFSPNGKLLWKKPWGYGNNTDDIAQQVCLDGAGNILVTGQGRNVNGTADYARVGCVTVKYDSSGNFLWARGTTTEADRIAQFYGGQQLVLMGRIQSRKAPWALRVVRRDEDEQAEWAYTDDRPYLEIGPVGVVQGLTGEYVGFNARIDKPVTWTLIKLDTLGRLVWTKKQETGYGTDQICAMLRTFVDNKEAIIVSGRTKLASGYGMLTIKYAP